MDFVANNMTILGFVLTVYLIFITERNRISTWHKEHKPDREQCYKSVRLIVEACNEGRLITRDTIDYERSKLSSHNYRGVLSKKLVTIIDVIIEHANTLVKDDCTQKDHIKNNIKQLWQHADKLFDKERL